MEHNAHEMRSKQAEAGAPEGNLGPRSWESREKE